MKRTMICKTCRISKDSDGLMPKSCFDKNGKWHKKHDWVKEKVCACGHGETSHYIRYGIIQCSVGDCFPFGSHREHIIDGTPWCNPKIVSYKKSQSQQEECKKKILKMSKTLWDILNKEENKYISKMNEMGEFSVPENIAIATTIAGRLYFELKNL